MYSYIKTSCLFCQEAKNHSGLSIAVEYKLINDLTVRYLSADLLEF